MFPLSVVMEGPARFVESVLFHPFVGLTNWKYQSAVSAKIHSLNVGEIAGHIYSVLTDGGDPELARVAGLLHDAAGKLPLQAQEVRGALDFIFGRLRDYMDEKEIGLVRVSAFKNIAENPGIFEFLDPELAVSLYIADRIASASTLVEAVTAFRNAQEMLEKYPNLGGVASKLSLSFYSVNPPQLFLRERLYEELRKKLKDYVENPSLIVAPPGVLLVHSSKENPGRIELDYSCLRAYSEDEILQWISNKKTREKFRVGMYARGALERPIVSERVRECLVNVEHIL